MVSSVFRIIRARVPCHTSALSVPMPLLWEGHRKGSRSRMGKQYERSRFEVRGSEARLSYRLGYHAPVEEIDAAFGAGDVARVVGGEADRRTAGVELLQHLHHRFTALGIEVAGGLVREHDRGAPGNRA